MAADTATATSTASRCDIFEYWIGIHLHSDQAGLQCNISLLRPPKAQGTSSSLEFLALFGRTHFGKRVARHSSVDTLIDSRSITLPHTGYSRLLFHCLQSAGLSSSEILSRSHCAALNHDNSDLNQWKKTSHHHDVGPINQHFRSVWPVFVLPPSI